MRVLFVTSEVAGLFKLGGLADVSRSLPSALEKIGVNVTLILPYYKSIKIAKPRGLGTLAVTYRNKRELVFVFTATLPGTKVPVILLRHPFLDKYDGAKIAVHFSFFALGVVALIRQAKFITGDNFDVIHCQDWHTSLTPLVLGENNKLTHQPPTIQARSNKTILTIHNMLYQGIMGVDIIDDLGLPRSIFHILGEKKHQYINVLREAFEYADVISAVSPSYAREITTPDFGQGLDPVLRKRRRNLVGILNGIDVDYWNPAHDKFLPFNFEKSTVIEVKKKITVKLQEELGLPKVNLPVFGFVGRLEIRQKGIDILLKALGKLLPDSEFQFVILGNGGLEIKDDIEKLAKKFKKNFVFRHEFNERLAHLIYAGADSLVIPSKFEPCGLTQMIAMRYGTLPLVRKTGGLGDSVDDGVDGFEFDKYLPSELSDKMNEVIKLWKEKPETWQKMVATAMARDFSWKKSAKAYVKLYRDLLAQKYSRAWT